MIVFVKGVFSGDFHRLFWRLKLNGGSSFRFCCWFFKIDKTMKGTIKKKGR